MEALDHIYGVMVGKDANQVAFHTCQIYFIYHITLLQ